MDLLFSGDFFFALRALLAFCFRIFSLCLSDSVSRPSISFSYFSTRARLARNLFIPRARSLPIFTSIPVGILLALVLYINDFPDYEADKQANKKTLVVILGKKRAIWFYPAFLMLTYMLIIGGVLGGKFPIPALISLLTIPFAFRANNVAMKNFDRIIQLFPANAATIIIHLFLGLLLSMGYILDKVI